MLATWMKPFRWGRMHVYLGGRRVEEWKSGRVEEVEEVEEVEAKVGSSDVVM
jgi:hypothetical protein